MNQNWLSSSIALTALLITSCRDGNIDSSPAPSTTKDHPTLTLSFEFAEQKANRWPNIYAAWLENEKGDLQHLYVCNKLVKGGLTNWENALPFWHLNRYDDSNRRIKRDVDGVTGATQSNRDFTIMRPVEARMGDQFTLYFEIDQSFQFNDWFPGTHEHDSRDQPAVLYAAEIDLTNSTTEYTLKPVGWTPMEKLTVAGVPRSIGTLVPEMRFITHKRIDDAPTFGAPDSDKSAIRSIDSIKARIKF